MAVGALLVEDDFAVAAGCAAVLEGFYAQVQVGGANWDVVAGAVHKVTGDVVGAGDGGTQGIPTSGERLVWADVECRSGTCGGWSLLVLEKRRETKGWGKLLEGGW